MQGRKIYFRIKQYMMLYSTVVGEMRCSSINGDTQICTLHQIKHQG